MSSEREQDRITIWDFIAVAGVVVLFFL